VAVAGLAACASNKPPDAPLFAGIDQVSYADGSAMIQRQLDARFPKGAPAKSLAAYLVEQGMTVEQRAGSATTTAGVAQVRFGASVCGSQVRVTWEAGVDQSIRKIHVLYSDTGCL
jgi:hypothetical protein